MELPELFGFIAALLTTSAFVPQVYKSYKTRHTADLSWGWLLLVSLGIFCWLIYGLMTSNTPLIAANTLTIILALILIGLKIKYG